VYSMANVTKPAKEILTEMSKEFNISQAGILSCLVLLMKAHLQNNESTFGVIESLDLDEMRKHFPSQDTMTHVWEIRSKAFKDFVKSHEGKTYKYVSHDAIYNHMLDLFGVYFQPWMLNSVICHAYGKDELDWDEERSSESLGVLDCKFCNKVGIKVEEKYWKTLSVKIKAWRRK
jgi:hypothetical protein